MFHTPSAHYDATAKLLHWLMALMIFGLLGLGFYMQGLPLSPQKLQFYSWHKWAGVTVFFLALLRLVWRATHQPPALPGHMSTLERWGAKLGHSAVGLADELGQRHPDGMVWRAAAARPVGEKQRNWQCLANFARRFESDANCRTAGRRCRSAQAP